MEQIPILLLEYENYWLTANTLYCLMRNKGFDIHFISRNPRSPFRFSSRVKSHHYFPKEQSDEAFLNFAKKVVQKTKASVMVPINDTGFHFMINNKEALQPFVSVIPLPEPWAYQIAGDKGLLADFMQSHAIDGPPTITHLGDNLDAQLDRLSFPVLLKPRMGSGGRGAAGEPGITKFHNKEELLKFVAAHNIASKYIIQSYVEGPEIDCNVLYKEGQLVTYTIQKAMLATQRYSPSLGIEFVDDKKVIEVVDSLLSKLRWNGVAHIDLIYDRHTQSLRILEINPRFWLTVGGSMVRANVNFPALACLQALDQPIEQRPVVLGRYIPVLSFLKYRVRTGNKTPFRWREIDVRYFFTNIVTRVCYFYNKRFK